MEEQRRLKEALDYAKTAVETYDQLQKNDQEPNDIYVFAQWQKISIAYSLHNKEIKEYCKLWRS